MKTNISLSAAPFGVIGVVGHAGCGHANSHLGFIQDDSGGLSAVLGLLREATGLSLEIAECNVHTGLEDAYFQVKTVSGGEGIGTALQLQRPVWHLIASESRPFVRKRLRWIASEES